MSTQKVLVNDTVRVRVRFVDINPTTGEEEDLSPLTVAVEITDSSSNVVVSENANAFSSSSFYYDFVPTAAGEFNVKFSGILEIGRAHV